MIDKQLPNLTGIYLMRDWTGKILYIGKAKNLNKRINSYFTKTQEPKINLLLTQVKHIDYIPTASERESLILEQDLIKKLQPPFNVIWKDDKSYPYLKLTAEDFPRIFLTRKILKDGLYYGPFPYVSAVRKLLRFLKRKKFFPLRQCRLEFSEKKLPDKKKVLNCLYLQTEECPAPCIGKISKKEYKKIVNEVKLFFKRDYKKLKEIWQKNMKELAKKLQFEKAAIIRDNINYLEKITQKITTNKISMDEVENKLSISQTIFNLKKILKLNSLPIRIESFDVSNISGNFACGAMVSFLNGIPDKKNYRRFKIKTVSGIDDYSMMKEIIKRRYTRLLNEGKKLPDLILIDGGIAHLNAAANVLKQLNINIHRLVAIAKPDDKVFSPQFNSEIPFPENSAELKFLQRIRDETHRFAIQYYHLLHRKQIVA